MSKMNWPNTMAEIVIATTPSFDGHGKRRHGRFDVRLKDSDEIICEATQQPLLDAARIMLRRGVDPSIVICKVRSDASTVVTMRAPIGVAAQYDVMGERFVRRKPDAGPMSGSGIENPISAGPLVPGSTNATLGASHNGPLKTANATSLTSSVAPSLPRSLTSATTTGN
jgi:hypothetical protein